MRTATPLVAVVVSTLLGTLLGLALARRRFRGRAATQTLILVPMVTPEIVMGLSLLIFIFQLFGVTPEINAISTIIVAVTAVVILAAWRISQRRYAALAGDVDHPGENG